MIQNIDYIDKNRITRGIVANANNDLILKTIMDAESQKLINPVLIGNIEFMTAFIDKHKWSLSKDKLIESYSEEESSKIACEVASRDTGLEKNIIIKMIGILNRKLFFEIINLPMSYNPANCRVVN